MKRKIVCFVLCGILLTLITIFPTLTPQEPSFAPLSARSIENIDRTTHEVNHFENMTYMYKKMIEKINDGEDPLEEFVFFSSDPHIQTIIQSLSDNHTMQAITTLFSEKPILTKLPSLKRYALFTESIQQNESVQSFDRLLEHLANTNLTLHEDIPLFDADFLSDHNKTLLSTGWTDYLDTHPLIKHIISNLEMNPAVFLLVFALSIGIWGFGIGAVSCVIPELLPLGIMITEALILGLAGSLFTDAIFSSDIPMINRLIEVTCNALALTETQLEVLIASLCCLIVLGTYLYLWEICPITQLSAIIKGIGGGSFVIAPPLLIAWFLASYAPSGQY